jgi:hypothetical protein
MREPDPLSIAVRAFAPPRSRDRSNSSGDKDEHATAKRPTSLGHQRRASAVLVLDVETRADAGQGFILGAFRFCRVGWEGADPMLTCVDEGLFFPDDLAVRDPAGYALLRRYTGRALPATDLELKDARRSLGLLPLQEFIRDVFLSAIDAQATVVGFNLPFDLSRLARGWGPAKKAYAGGFSFMISEYTDYQGRQRPDTSVPRLLVRSFDSRRARMGLGTVRPFSDPDAAVRGRGSFLDLRMLAHTLSGRAHTLESACAEFGVPYKKRSVELGRLSRRLVDYCREDVAATAGLWEALAREYECWDMQRAPTYAYSGASLAKAILHEAGIEPILKRQPGFPDAVIGYAMTSYFGGRSEVRIRCIPVPVTTLDFRSMHPTVAVLTRLSRFLTCEQIDVVEEEQ